MKAGDLYHSGIVVDDLDATMDWFTKVAGYRWTDVVEVEQQGGDAGWRSDDPHADGLLGADPPLEFLQTVPGTIWVPADSRCPPCGLLVRRPRD